MPLNHLNPEVIGRGLALTGGGVRGIFTASVLREFEQRLNRNLRDSFHVVSGTSVGGIIALAISCGISCDKIARRLLSSADHIFGEPARFNPWKSRTSSHDPEKLAGVVKDVLGDQATRKIRSLETNVVVLSVDARLNEVVYFSNIERIGTSRCKDATLLDVAMATSAAPTYFPPHKIGIECYLDGGIVSNSPDAEALRFLQEVLARPIEHIQLLSVGTGKTYFDFDCSSKSRHGAIAWIKKHRLIDRIMTLQESKATELVSELLGSRYLRVDTHFEEKIDLDETDQGVLRMLADRGQEVAKEKWAANPSRVASFLR